MTNGFANSFASQRKEDVSELAYCAISENPSEFFFLPPRIGLRGHIYRTLKGTDRLRRRSGVFSVLAVKHVIGVSGHATLIKKAFGPPMVPKISRKPCVGSAPLCLDFMLWFVCFRFPRTHYFFRTYSFCWAPVPILPFINKKISN